MDKYASVYRPKTHTPPPSPSIFITLEDIDVAIQDAKSSTSSKDQTVKWDIVYELWTHYQRQEDKKFYEKKDVLDAFCDIDQEGSLECREYDL